MKPVMRLAVMAALLAGVAVPAAAQRPTYKREVPPRLLRQAKVSEDSALKVAQARIPMGRVQELALENEKGQLIWSFAFSVPNRPGTYEVNVSAVNGALVGPVQHELPRDTAHVHGASRPRTRAQQLVNRTVAAHPELEGLELALVTGGVCKTVAATAPEDIGERCDADELGPMRTGEPDVEAPSASDPVYDITQALHDAAGRLIGAVGMDLKPAAGEDRAAMVARARAILREMEAAVPSKAALLAPASAR